MVASDDKMGVGMRKAAGSPSVRIEYNVGTSAFLAKARGKRRMITLAFTYLGRDWVPV